MMNEITKHDFNIVIEKDCDLRIFKCLPYNATHGMFKQNKLDV